MALAAFDRQLGLLQLEYVDMYMIHWPTPFNWRSGATWTAFTQLRDEGRCVIFSSHIMQEVAALCDRIVVIAQGKVVAQGTADELRAQTGEENLEDAFVRVIGSEEGLLQ